MSEITYIITNLIYSFPAIFLNNLFHCCFLVVQIASKRYKSAIGMVAIMSHLGFRVNAVKSKE